MLPEIQERTWKKHARTCSTCPSDMGYRVPHVGRLVFVMFCTCSFMFCLYFGQIHALVFGEQFSTRGMFLMFLLIFYQCTWRVQVQNKQDTSYIIVWVILQVIMHYIPLAEVGRRLLCNRKFKGHQYHGFEIQYSEQKPGARAFGRSNSTLWFETAQASTDYMLHARGDAGPCRVAGLLVCSDNSYCGKNMGFHGVYCMPNEACTMLVPCCSMLVLFLYLSCILMQYMLVLV